MVHIRKARAGNDSFGNQWPEDDAVVDIPVEQAAVLMAIPDGGFSEAPAPKKEPEQEEQEEDGGGQSDPGSGGDSPPPGDGEKTADSEGAEQKTDVDEAPKPARRGRPPKKTVEE